MSMFLDCFVLIFFQSQPKQKKFQQIIETWGHYSSPMKNYNKIEISMYKFVYIYKYDMINNICLCTDILNNRKLINKNHN